MEPYRPYMRSEREAKAIDGFKFRAINYMEIRKQRWTKLHTDEQSCTCGLADVFPRIRRIKRGDQEGGWYLGFVEVDLQGR